MKQIVDVRDSLQQGAARATECVAADGVRYVVKHSNGGAGGLVREWIAGRIGRAMGLPIPPIEILVLDREQATFMAQRDANSIARYPGFGSEWVDDAAEMLPADMIAVPGELRKTILLFDWWVMNGDRTERNPNLLWVAHRRKVQVIDHNMAFDDTATDFWDRHVFRNMRATWGREFRDEMSKKMVEQRARLPEYWAEIPKIWLNQKNENVPTFKSVDIMLGRFVDDPEGFWDRP